MTENGYWSSIGIYINDFISKRQLTDKRLFNYPPAFQNDYINDINDKFITCNKCFNQKIACCGINITNNIAFVPWIDNRINVFPLKPNQIAVSYGFAGCYMAKFDFLNKTYIAHIHSSDTPSCDCKCIWNNIVANFNMEIHALFKPVKVGDSMYEEMSRGRTFINARISNTRTIGGVIEMNNTCSSILVDCISDKALETRQMAHLNTGGII